MKGPVPEKNRARGARTFLFSPGSENPAKMQTKYWRIKYGINHAKI
jgi:hypothetical protein